MASLPTTAIGVTKPSQYICYFKLRRVDKTNIVIGEKLRQRLKTSMERRFPATILEGCVVFCCVRGVQMPRNLMVS